MMKAWARRPPFWREMAIFQKSVIGLDVSDRSIEAVLVVRKGDRYVVASYGRTELPPGLIVDGFVERRDEAAVILRKLLADQMTPPLPKGVDAVALAVPESQVYSHIFEVPRVADDAGLARFLAVEADGHFPYNHQEMAGGYTVTAIRPDKKEIFYAAVHRDTLQSFLSLLAAAGLRAAVIEGESTSIARATLPADENGPVVFVDIGARVTNVAVFDRNGIQFSETLATAGDAFTAALSRSLNLPPDDAESLKRNHGLSEQLDLRAQKALRAEVDRLVADIREAVRYYEGRSKRLVTRVIVCGGSILMPGLLEALQGGIPTKERPYAVELADPWGGLEFDETLEKLGVRARGVLVATAVGLALRGAGVRKFPEIDFLPGLAAVTEKPVRAAKPPAARSTATTFPSAAAGRPAAFLRWPLWLKAGAAVAGVLALAAAIWATAFLIIPRFRGKVTAPAPAAPAVVALEIRAAVGAAFSAEPPVLEGVRIDVESEVERSFAREAARREGKARGQVEIVNESGASQTLVATTRLLSSGGVLFRLDERVIVPPRSRVTAAVTADQPGPQGDVPAGRFTIPGLSSALQRVIYAESSEPMKGGVVLEGAPFTEADLAAAQDAILDGAEETLLHVAAEKAGDELIVLGDLLSAEARIVSAPTVGEPTGDFTVKAVLEGRALALSREEIGRHLQTALSARLGPGEDAAMYALSEPVIEVVEADLEAGTATVIIRAEAKR